MPSQTNQRIEHLEIYVQFSLDNNDEQKGEIVYHTDCRTICCRQYDDVNHIIHQSYDAPTVCLATFILKI